MRNYQGKILFFFVVFDEDGDEDNDDDIVIVFRMGESLICLQIQSMDFLLRNRLKTWKKEEIN